MVAETSPVKRVDTRSWLCVTLSRRLLLQSGCTVLHYHMLPTDYSSTGVGKREMGGTWDPDLACSGCSFLPSSPWRFLHVTKVFWAANKLKEAVQVSSRVNTSGQ